MVAFWRLTTVLHLTLGVGNWTLARACRRQNPGYRHALRGPRQARRLLFRANQCPEQWHDEKEESEDDFGQKWVPVPGLLPQLADEQVPPPVAQIISGFDSVQILCGAEGSSYLGVCFSSLSSFFLILYFFLQNKFITYSTNSYIRYCRVLFFF